MLSGDQTITPRFGTASVDERNPVVPSEWSGIIDRAVSSHGSIVLTLDCSFSTNERLDVALFDISGRRVERLLNAETAAGEHRIQLSIKRVARGVYYYRIHTDNAVITRMITVQ